MKKSSGYVKRGLLEILLILGASAILALTTLQVLAWLR